MLTPGKPQHLGNRSMMLILYRRTTIAFFLFIISGAVAFIGPSIAVGVAGLTSIGGDISQTAVNSISSFITTIDIIVLLLSVIAFLVGIILGMLEYRTHFFILDEFGIHVRRGIINHDEVSIPYRQIQDMNLMRSLVHRMFGVSRLIMITAGHEDSVDHEQVDTIFDPIDADLAVEIREYLDKKIGVQMVEQVPVESNASAQDKI